MATNRLTIRAAPSQPGPRPAWRVLVLGFVVVVFANAPLAIWALAFQGRGAGDARTHAMLAYAIARHGLAHGWTDAYGGGFPLGPHYPVVGWLLSAFLVKTGLQPMVAVSAVGFVSLLGAPILAFLVALRAGARPFAAITCALFLSWVTPGGYFVGGYEAFYGLGLLSQVMTVPIVVLLFGAIARHGPPWRATLAAVLAVSCHPQIATACLVVLLFTALASGTEAS